MNNLVNCVPRCKQKQGNAWKTEVGQGVAGSFEFIFKEVSMIFRESKDSRELRMVEHE